jgi:uncharacterized protein DUF5069
MKLPLPEAQLAGCVWLPRIVAKARAIQAGTLSEEYAIRFGAPDGVDGVFLRFFELTKEQIAAAAHHPDVAVERWFVNLPTVSAKRIEEWNHVGMNLGRPGFPLADRLPIGPTSKYAHLAERGIQTIFEMLRADEAL